MQIYSLLMNTLILASSLIVTLTTCFTYDKKNVGETYKLEVPVTTVFQYEVCSFHLI